MPISSALSPLQKLAAKWRVIGLIAVAYARLLLRCEDGRGQGAELQAEQLYVAVRAAQVMLVQDLAETLEVHPPQTDADENTLVFLRAVAVYLLVIAMVIEDIMGRGELLGRAVWQSAGFGASTRADGAGTSVEDCKILDPG